MKCMHYRAMDSALGLENAVGKFYLRCEVLPEFTEYITN